ncbi:MAG TPA: metallophosphoesterase family protein [Solirubrobacteraceae bacterium]|nr:metallophosphoesterase family protein [Solirubrobacteraceae bacterium]
MGVKITHNPMQIALISDTHMPKGNRRLPDACVERLKAADLIVHAGDLSTLAILDELRTYSKVIAVHGNVDDAEVRAALPETATFEANGAQIAVIHDAGPATGRLERLRRRFPQADAVIFGHSHQPLHQEDPSGFQIFNPGSPTERRRAPWPSMGIARAEDGRLTFELIRLG